MFMSFCLTGRYIRKYPDFLNDFWYYALPAVLNTSFGWKKYSMSYFPSLGLQTVGQRGNNSKMAYVSECF